MRLYFVDNIRVTLTVFVVLHHVALTYGARHGWYFYEPTGDAATNAILTTFLAVNRAFFMGFFFMISGYFTPGSFERKGAGRFIQDRLLRLGIPLVFFACLVRPTIVYIMDLRTLVPRYSFWANIFEFRNVAPGPLWFVETLLIFSGLYVLWRLARPETGKGEKREGTAPGTVSIVLFALLLGLATFAVRVYFPPSVQVFHLRIGNYVQYVSLFIVGLIAWRRGWMSGLGNCPGRFWLPVTSAALIAYVAVIASFYRSGTLSLLTGRLRWESLLGAMLESFLCIGMMMSLLLVCSKKWNFQGRLTKAMSGDSYTVYIMHAPIIVAFTYLVHPMLRGYPLVKFCAVSVCGVALCFLISHYIRKLPLARNIL